jgi:hypothetical protein
LHARQATLGLDADEGWNGGSEAEKVTIFWRCFHCGDTFTKAQRQWARYHFGSNEGEQPVCLIRSAGEDALLVAMRNMQDELARHRAEDSDLIRAMWSMQADHRSALLRAEEGGYTKGVRDARVEQLEGMS